MEIILLLGLPGSGKSTLVNRLACCVPEKRIKIFSLRKYADYIIFNGINKPLILEIQRQRNLYGRLDGNCSNRMFDVFMSKNHNEADLAVLENYPLSERQVMHFRKALLNSQTPTTIKVIYLYANTEILAERMQSRKVCMTCDQLGWVEKSYKSSDTVCPICGSLLTSRTDDVNVEGRIEAYQDKLDKVMSFLGYEKHLIDTSYLSEDSILSRVSDILNLELRK